MGEGFEPSRTSPPDADRRPETPRRARLERRVRRNHSLAIAAASGDVLAWGGARAGPRGRGDPADVATPTRIDPAAFGNERAAQISAGDEHSVAVTESGAVFSWGASAGGGSGTGARATRRARAVSEDDGGEASAPPRRLAVSPVKRVFGLPRGRECSSPSPRGRARSRSSARGPPPRRRGGDRRRSCAG